MEVEIARLNAADYDEWLLLLNRTFTVAHNNVPMDFEKELPKMCKRTDFAMNKHFGLRKNGVLKAALGVYPLPVKVAGEQLLFSTVGNVATLPEETGHGYMSQLLDTAMQELKDIGADASRLGGKRSRYRRYGYEPVGSLCHYVLELNQWPHDLLPETVCFVPITKQNKSLLEKARELHQSGSFVVVRTDEDAFYDTLVAWKNVPYAALNVAGELIGYLSVSTDRDSIAEIECCSLEAFQSIIYGWLRQMSPKLSISLMPHRLQENFFLSDFCTSSSISAPCHFKILHWDRVINSFLKLKASYTDFPNFERLIEIKGYGVLLLQTSGQDANCILTTDKSSKADISLSWYQASRLFFGAMPMFADHLGFGSILPLPLSWNLQDRV